MNEEWRDVVGYEGLYKVSNLGNVYSCYTNKMSSPGTHKGGYKYVTLYKNGTKKTVEIHRLVAIAFLNNPNNLLIVNHKDENPSNNNVNNLEWCTSSYNCMYNNAHIKRAEKYSKLVYMYDELGSIVDYKSVKEISKILNLDINSIYDCCARTHHTCGGYVLSYIELSKQEVLNIIERKNKLTSKPKRVNQYDLNGNLLNSYRSISEATKKLGFKKDIFISRVCNGERKQTHGFIFKFADE